MKERFNLTKPSVTITGKFMSRKTITKEHQDMTEFGPMTTHRTIEHHDDFEIPDMPSGWSCAEVQALEDKITALEIEQVRHIEIIQEGFAERIKELEKSRAWFEMQHNNGLDVCIDQSKKITALEAKLKQIANDMDLSREEMEVEGFYGRACSRLLAKNMKLTEEVKTLTAILKK